MLERTDAALPFLWVDLLHHNSTGYVARIGLIDPIATVGLAHTRSLAERSTRDPR